jgi:hypothetical protein
MVTIKISGPGGCVSYQTAIIRKALREAGIEPIMTGDGNYPYDGRDYNNSESEEEFIIRVGKLVKDRNGRDDKTTIDVYNAPWGG